MTSSKETSNLAADYSRGVSSRTSPEIPLLVVLSSYDIGYTGCLQSPLGTLLICAALLPLIMHASATLVHNLKGHTDEVGRLLFSLDGKKLAACDDLIITLWDVDTGTLRSKFEPLNDQFFEMAFSPDSKWIAAASEDGHARVWSTKTGQLKHVLSVEDERMLSLVFSADSKSIVTGSENLRIWDVATGELRHTLSAPDDRSLSFTAVHERGEFPYPPEISEVAFSLDGKLLASACPNTSTISLWDTESWKLGHTIQGCALDFSADGKHLAVWVSDHETIQIYNTNTWQLQSAIEKKEDGAFPGVFSPDSKSFVTKSGHQIQIWSAETGKAIKTFVNSRQKVLAEFEDPQEEICKLVFSPDGKILISGAEECSLRLQKVEDGDLLLELQHEDGARDVYNSSWTRGDPPAVEVLFGDDGGKVAIAFPDGSVRIWDVRWETT
ncbi:WD40 repeat-like protein [Aureobasidium sp. EXF-12298]|nr:WD40 repeat-like protein [Aureobasidium sp. EXF-12298]KAI4762668.1 WD40 repeat-like protein [Aureobasidium sp. EXF-12344]KAI4779898.1 WD40 repeat-like protein [Aureobasidium sp. EXF-3400]